MADQLRWDGVAAYWSEGTAPLRTPHLDRIAREGARVERCYTASPICMPARASMLTGRWPHAHGLWDNGVRLPRETVTIGTVFSQRGYRTGIVGKGHLDVHRLPESDSPDSFEGWNTPEALALGGKNGWHGPYYGFQEAHLTCGHNKASGHYGTWLHKNHPKAVRLLEREHAVESPVGEAWKSALPVELHASTWIGDRSVEFIRGRAAAQQPFFLWTSFPDPHPPLCPPKEYADRYDPAAMPPSLRRPGELADKPPHFRGEVDSAHEPGWRPFGPGHVAHEPRDEREDAHAKAAYYAMIELVDHNVGRILAALDETGQADNTIVAVIADHGEMLGDHWLDGKGPWHYDGCTRVPLLFRYPNAVPAGTYVRGFGSQCDLAPTLCDLAGVPYTTWPPSDESYAGGRLTATGVLPDVQGVSLAPALRAGGEAQSPRTHVLMETEWRWYPGLQLKTLRTPEWRLTVYAGRPYGELYELRNDPDEFVNRWDDAAVRLTRLELTEQLLQDVLTSEGRLPPRLVEN
jgi:arylsulfatase